MTRSRERRDDEKEQRREAIIDAAEQVFASTGFDAAKMEDVARSARVSRALLYLYFDNKAELYFAICLRALRMLREQFSAAISDQPSGYAQVLAIGRCYVRFADQHPLHFAAMARFEAHRPDATQLGATEQAVLEAGNAVHAVTIAALQAGIADGSIRRLDDLQLVAITLWGFIHGTIQIAQTKDLVLEQAGIPVEAFLTQALQLGMHSIASDGTRATKRKPAK